MNLHCIFCIHVGGKAKEAITVYGGVATCNEHMGYADKVATGTSWNQVVTDLRIETMRSRAQQGQR